MSEPPAFAAGDRVIYVPLHARDDRTHPDCEPGTVSSVSKLGTIFVVFDGRERTGPMACGADTLVYERTLPRTKR